HISSIAVLPKYRNLGYGEKLLDRLLKLFREHNKIIIRLEVRVSNEKAIKLYKKFGFKISKVKKHYYSNNEDAYLMKLKLVN
ncbi:MAG: GNAT family N-acetyltransferase, partial [Candidatus Lokiarchaeota archaeon]|nr:GNAT family N-acetyltransferase [Candidatus Lokiarchaeota archaeon]